MPFLALLVLGVTAGSLTCGFDPHGTKGPGDRILVLAASSLDRALPEVIEEFTRRTGVEVDLVLSSSGNLATQIERGAPADVFLSADGIFLDRLEEKGLLLAGTRTTYGAGRLALIWSDRVPPPEDLESLGTEAHRRIALANPDHAPYGRAAREVLERTGHLERLSPGIILAGNAAQAHQFVRTGNADAGLVALALVAHEPSHTYRVVEEGGGGLLRQEGAVLSGASRPDEAREFLRFLLAEEAQEVLGSRGFLSADPS